MRSVLLVCVTAWIVVCQQLSEKPNVQTVQTGIATEQLERDRAEILGHIHGIFQAYLRQDPETIRRTHVREWTGFQGPSTKIERGIEDYMKNAERSLESFQGTAYELLDTEVQVYGDLAIVYYVARYDYRDKKTGDTGSLPLRSVDIYSRERDGWNQIGSHIAVIRSGGLWGENDGRSGQLIGNSGAGKSSTSTSLSPAERDALLLAREAVWRAWFGGDRVRLAALIPEETIAIDPGNSVWADQSAIFARSEEFRISKAKLTRLEFPNTKIQAYGDVAILYTTYAFEVEKDGQRTTTAGRGTEIFIRRDGKWLNCGWHLDSGQ